MKTAVSVPDQLFEAADQLAKKLGKSRSQLYAEALADYVHRHDDDAITAALNAYADEVDTELDAFGREAARQTMRRNDW